MRAGMLWFDDRNAPLPDKLERAAEHYQAKYGARPTLCYIHPTMAHLAGLHGNAIINRIQVKANDIVLLNHLWIGMAQEPSPEEAA